MPNGLLLTTKRIIAELPLVGRPSRRLFRALRQKGPIPKKGKGKVKLAPPANPAKATVPEKGKRKATWAAPVIPAKAKAKKRPAPKEFGLNPLGSRESMIAVASSAGSDKLRLKIANHLFMLRNFHSASLVAEGIDPHYLSHADLLQVIRTHTSGRQGVKADSLLERLVQKGNFQALPPRTLVLLAQAVRFSGFDYHRKVELIERTLEFADQNWAREVRFQMFRLQVDSDTAVDVLKYAELDKLDLDAPAPHLRYLSHLKAQGYEQEARNVIARLLERHGASNPAIISAALNHDADWPLSLTDLQSAHLSQWRIIELLSMRRDKDDEHRRLWALALAECIRCACSTNIYERNRSLSNLLRLDEIDLVLADSGRDDAHPNTILAPTVAAGLRYFQVDEFVSAKDRFTRVLEEDPSDATAAQGLRLTLPRVGGSMASILEVRDRVGYGIAGAGRVGRRFDVGSEGCVSLLMSGQYQRGLYAKRHAKHWRLLKQMYGSRFLNFERLPPAGEARSLFLIGDEGVGDEVRTAQFYRFLSDRFSEVTVSCDPRLEALFARSFPTFRFVPVDRKRKGVVHTAATPKGRIVGLNAKLAATLTDDCRPLMDAADVITFGQNLFFNRFIGNLPWNPKGGYLKADGSLKNNDGPLRVGILWRSHFMSMWRKFMYLKIEDLAPLFGMDDVEFWSVQHAIHPQEKAFCESHGVKFFEGVDLFNDFEGMAPYLKSLDLVVGISSLPIELAAALGTPVWMLGFSPENYFLRTSGGRTDVDQLTTNSRVVAPTWIDFAAPSAECVSLVMGETKRLLQGLAAKRASPFHDWSVAQTEPIFKSARHFPSEERLHL